MKKRILSLLLAMLMIMTLVPAVASADKIPGDKAYKVVGDSQYGNFIYYNPDTGEITDCEKSVTEAVIPEEIDGVKITSIEGYHEIRYSNKTSKYYGAFYSCGKLCKVVIPGSVTTIGTGAFGDCVLLRSVVLSEGLKKIWSSAFAGCRQLTQIVVPDTVEYIGSCAFSKCSSLTSVVLPDSLKAINNDQFYGCESLSTIMIPKNVTEICEYSFAKCKSLKSVYLPKGIELIDKRAFFNCDNITDVYYEGTEAEWGKVDIRELNNCLKNATIHYESKYLDHVHSYDEVVTVPTNCYEVGHTVHTCSCGYSYKDNYMGTGAGHDYKNGSCTRCGKKDPSYNNAVSFVDVPSTAYYYKPVQWAVANDITSGVGNNRFDPNGQCTRGQVVTFLWRAAGKPIVGTNVSFSDVSSDAFYYEAVKWAVANGITSGVGGNRFAPNDTCTRGQVVTFLHRAAGEPSASAVSSFADVSTDAFYYKAVNWAVANGITSGVGGNRFAPNDRCTRAQVVTFLYREKTKDIGTGTGTGTGKDINAIIESVKKSFSARLVVPSVGASDNYYCAVEYKNNTGSDVLFTGHVYANGKGCNSWDYSITLPSGGSNVIKYYRGLKTEDPIRDMYLDNSSTAWTILKIDGQSVYIRFGTNGLIAVGASPSSIGAY